ncbi:MAG: hypothetical protein FWD57_15115 [Polyangiaceae bacterium]|nr:hypothetical protein [Polyangiaceae bacterium]
MSTHVVFKCTRFVAAVLSATVAVIPMFGGCGCPCPCPNTAENAENRADNTRARPKPALPGVSQCVASEEAEEASIDLLGDLAVVRLSADAFVRLSANDRKMAYELMGAIRAAEPILYDQRNAHGLAVKNLAEELALHRNAIPDELRGKADSFTSLIFAHKGPRDPYFARKLEFTLSYAELEIAAIAVFKDGAALGSAKTETELRTWIQKLRPVLFDDRIAPRPAGKTAASARYSTQIQEIVARIRSARAFASIQQQQLLDLQIDAIQSNSDTARAAYLAKWRISSFPVDIIIGFWGPITESGDAEFVAHMYLANESGQDVFQRAIDAVRSNVAGGSPSLLTPVAPLPVVQVPLVIGSRGISNIIAQPDVDPVKLVYANDAVLQSRGLIGKAAVQALLVDKSRETVVAACLGDLQTTIQIARASVGKPTNHPAMRAVAMMHADATVLASPSPYIADGLLSDDGCAAYLGDVYLMSYLLSVGGLSADGSTAIAQMAGYRADSAVVAYAVERGAVKEVVRNGYSYLQVTGQDAWVSAMGDLRDASREVLMQKDQGRASKLVERKNAVSEQRWIRSAREHFSALGIPARIVWQPPVLKPIMDESGVIQDITLDEEANWLDASLVWLRGTAVR